MGGFHSIGDDDGENFSIGFGVRVEVKVLVGGGVRVLVRVGDRNWVKIRVWIWVMIGGGWLVPDGSFHLPHESVRITSRTEGFI